MIESMTHAIVVHQMRAENCFAYLVADGRTREAALVDPRADRVPDYLRELEVRGLRLRLVIETHTHADHLSGAAELRARTGAEVLLSARATSEVATRRLRDGDHVTLGDHEIEVAASPGHTADSVSLLVGGALLTGDALLVGGAGRTDFQNGSPEALYETLHKRFADLPGDLTVYPAHDYAGRTHSTLAQERGTNPLLLLSDRDRFIATLRAARQAKPANMDAIVAANNPRRQIVAPDYRRGACPRARRGGGAARGGRAPAGGVPRGASGAERLAAARRDHAAA